MVWREETAGRNGTACWRHLGGETRFRKSTKKPQLFHDTNLNTKLETEYSAVSVPHMLKNKVNQQVSSAVTYKCLLHSKSALRMPVTEATSCTVEHFFVQYSTWNEHNAAVV